MNDNLSWNCGVEGPSEDSNVEALRNRQIKNFLTLNFLAVGTPMLLMGDEVRRTQRGNNNAYSLDNEISWFDWDLCRRHAEIHRFARMMIAFRVRRDVAIEDSRLTLNELLAQARLRWHGVDLDRPDWSKDSHCVAFTVSSLRGRFTLHVMLNTYWEALDFELPVSAGQDGSRWRRWIDTSLPSPQDICEWEDASVVSGSRYTVAPRSTAILVEMKR
jgi:glycogen operon protein